MELQCDITEKLIKEVSGIVDLLKLETLDLHLKDENLGKIRKIQNLHLVPNLKILNLSYNNLSVIEGLNKLTVLVELNLAENFIRRIENLEPLISLQRLNLSGNQISRIPEGISTLKNLQILRFSRNDLSVIQDISYLGDIKSLSSLTIEDNPIMTIEQCIPYTIYCIRSLVMLNNSKVTPIAKESAIKRFGGNEMSQMKDLLSNEVNMLHHPSANLTTNSRSNNNTNVKRIENKYPIVLPPHAGSATFGSSFGQRSQMNLNDDEESSEDGGLTYVQTNRFMPKLQSSNSNTNAVVLPHSSAHQDVGNTRQETSSPTIPAPNQSISR